MYALVDRFRLFSLRELVTHSGRAAASVSVIAISAAFLVAVLGISGSITGSVERLGTDIAGNAAIEVTGVTDSGFAQAMQEQVAAVAGVRAAVPTVQVSLGTGSDAILLRGTDASSAALDSPLTSAVQNNTGLLLSVPNGVLVGPAIGHSKGDTFSLGSGEVTVAEVLRGGAFDRFNGGHFVLASLPQAQRLTDRPGQIDSLLVVLAPGSDIVAVRAGVTAAVADRAVVGDPGFKTAQTGSGIKLMKYAALMGASTAFIVAAFLIYTAMAMGIAQRRPLISTLRAVGGRGRMLVRDLFVEAAMLALIGGAIGAALGILLGRLAIAALPPATIQAVEARIDYSLPTQAIPVALAAAVITSQLASAIAARQIYRVSPIEAMAPVGVSAADSPRRWLPVAAVGAAVVLTIAALAITAAHRGMLSAAAIGALLAAEIALCFALARPIVLGAAMAARLLRAPGALGAATIERTPRRVWATLMTVTVAVTTTVATSGSNANTLDSARALFAPLAQADVWITTVDTNAYPAGPLLPADLAGKLATMPGVARVLPEQLSYAQVGSIKVMLVAAAPGVGNPVQGAIDEATLAKLYAGDGVVLSRDLGRQLGVEAGDELPLQTPSGLRKSEVLAVAPFFSLLAGSIAMQLEQLQEWFERPGATALQVDAADGVDKDKLLADIRAVVPPEFYVNTGAAALEGFSSSLSQAMSLSSSVWIIVAIIAAVALLNTLMLSVLERRRELGVLRAIGSSRSFALRMVLAEAAGIGIVGGAIGLVLGLTNQSLSAVVATDILGFDVAYEPSPVVLAFAGVALALSSLGSLPPALRAARLEIVEAIAVE
jgi:putative ABC transport system permease protein